MNEEMRRRAEAIQRADPDQAPTVPTTEIKRLVHELQVHQIELEMQNDELRQAQAQLAESLDRYAELYDFAPLGYLTLDRDSRILQSNFPAAGLLGCERGRLVGRRFTDFVQREAQDDWFRHHRRTLTAERKQSVELTLRQVDGREFAARVESQPRPTEPPEDWRCLVAILDITERVEARRELDQERELMRSVVENVPVLLVMWDPGLERFTLNRHTREVLGWTTEDANQGDFMEKVYPDDVYRAQVEAFMLQRDVQWQEFRATTRDGQEVPIEWTNIQLTDDTCVGIGVDLRERKAHERRLERANRQLEQRVRERTAELQESETKFRTLAEESPNLVMISQGGRTAYVNQTLVKTLKYPRATYFAPDFDPGSLCAPKSDDLLRHRIERQASGEDLAPVELTLRAADGEHIELLLATRLIDYGGKKAVLCLMNDITELRKKTRELDEHRRRLRALTTDLVVAEEKERRRIAAGLHDDVNQLVVGAKMRLRRVGESEDRGEVHAAVERVEDLLDRTLEKNRSLIFDLVCPSLEKLGLEAALEGLCQRVGETEAVDVSWECGQIDPYLDPEVQIVVYHAVREMLRNVVKHAEATRAWVRTRRTDNKFEVEVLDNGVGLRGRTPAKPGDFDDSGGFGLYNIGERIEHLGGRFLFEEAPSRGCRAVIVLPASGREDTP